MPVLLLKQAGALALSPPSLTSSGSDSDSVSGLQAGLQIQGLSLRTAEPSAILDNLTLDLPAGQVTGVLGPNGAGKTSLLRAFAGFDSAPLNRTGEVRWQGQSTHDMSVQARARVISMVSQMHDSVFALSLNQVVRMGLLPHQGLFSMPSASDEQEVADALQRVGLANKAQRVFSSLSGGEQQRGLIARALVQKAQLLILDEPINHLDVYYQHDVLGLLRQLSHRHGLTVVMSLHDLNLASFYCDQLVLLQHGKLQAAGRSVDVLDAELLERVFGLPCVVRHEPHGSRVDFCPSGTGYGLSEASPLTTSPATPPTTPQEGSA